MFRVSYHLISYYVNVHNVNMIVSCLTMTCSDMVKYVDSFYEMNRIYQFCSFNYHLCDNHSPEVVYLILHF